jgi:hypothetical protein
MYSKPLTVKIPHDLLVNGDIFESFCEENEKDRVYLQKQYGGYLPTWCSGWLFARGK